MTYTIGGWDATESALPSSSSAYPGEAGEASEGSEKWTWALALTPTCGTDSAGATREAWAAPALQMDI